MRFSKVQKILEDSDYRLERVMYTPKSLHRDLAIRAECEGVSLNQLAVTLLAKSLR
jgi:predicted HicB family RNase H-like nuclease